MTHVLLISSSNPVNKDGSAAAGSFVHDFANELSKFINITIVTPGNDDSIIKLDNITVIQFKVPKLPLSLLKIYLPTHWIYIFNTIRFGSSVVTNVLKQTDVDHIFALWVLPSGYWAYKAYKEFNVSYSCWALGSDIWSFQNNYFTRKLLKIILINSENLFSDGMELKKDVTSICGKECSFLPSTRQLPNSKKYQGLNGTGTRLAYLGRWHANKGIDLLLEALISLNGSDWESISEFVFAGGGPLENSVKEKCRHLQDNNRPITLLGFLNKKDASSLISWADYLVIPSRIESIPVVLSDAIQKCTPVIATPVGDLPRLFNKYILGILCDSVTVGSIATSIKLSLHTSPSKFNNSIKNAQSVFNINSIAKQYLSSLGINT